VTHHGPYDWLQRVLPGMGGMRAPSRFVVIVIAGMSVLIGYGALALLELVPSRVHAVTIILLLAGVVADGWAVPIPIVAYSPRGRLEDRAIAEWLRGKPPGAVLHLPLMTAQFQELHYQYATLFHDHPMINGFTGWPSPLLQLLRHPRAPLYDYARYPATVTIRVRAFWRPQRHPVGERRAAGDGRRIPPVRAIARRSAAVRRLRLRAGAVSG
jgi:hypothetical protein